MVKRPVVRLNGDAVAEAVLVLAQQLVGAGDAITITPSALQQLRPVMRAMPTDAWIAAVTATITSLHA